MLHRLKLRCGMPSGSRFSTNWGVALHGALMKRLTPEAGTLLHLESTRPFSQHVRMIDKRSMEWHIGIWDDRVAEEIMRAVLPLTEVMIYSTPIQIEHCERHSMQEDELFGQIWAADQVVRQYEIRYLTPSTHKSDGEYVVFPSPAYIYHSIAERFSDHSDRFQLKDPQVIAQLSESTRITRYALRSEPYVMKGARLPAYAGFVVLTIDGPEPLVKLAGMLLSLAEYQGIGIKTAMGMGGVEVLPVGRR